MSNAKLRRNLRRIAERNGISYTQAILRFYGIKHISQLDKNLFWSLTKRTSLWKGTHGDGE